MRLKQMMTRPTGSENNRILSATYTSLYWTMFLSTLVMTINIMLDTVMAGRFFDMNALAGIGVCGVFSTMVTMMQGFLVMSFVDSMGSALGRGDTEESNRIFSCMIWLNAFMQIFFIILSFAAPDRIVWLLGARDPQIAVYAVQYIRILSIASLAATLDKLILNPMLLFGFHKEIFFSYVIQLIINILLSLFFTQVLHTGVAGLAWGTASGSACAFLFLLTAYLHRPSTLHLYVRPSHRTFKTAWPSIKGGLPSTIHSFADFILGLIFNNVIAARGIAGGLAVYTIYISMRNLANISASAALTTSNTLFSVLLGSRDVDGIKRVLKETFTRPLRVTMIVLLIMLAGRMPLLSAFGVTDQSMIRVLNSAFFWLIPGCFLSVPVNVFRNFFALSDRISLSGWFAVGADFIIYVPLVLVSLRYMGIATAWISYTVCFVIFIAIWISMLRLYLKRPLRSVEDFLLLPEDYFEGQNLLNISLKGGIRESKKIAGIGDFLSGRGICKKDAYRCQLCVEEIAMRLSEGKKMPKYLDIRIFTVRGNVHFSIRDKGPMNNYLVFVPKDMFDGVGIRIVRAVAKRVDYRYLMGINVLNVTI
jgi:Na+-driven multidrug efflux pump